MSEELPEPLVLGLDGDEVLPEPLVLGLDGDEVLPEPLPMLPEPLLPAPVVLLPLARSSRRHFSFSSPVIASHLVLELVAALPLAPVLLLVEGAELLPDALLPDGEEVLLLDGEDVLPEALDGDDVLPLLVLGGVAALSELPGALELWANAVLDSANSATVAMPTNFNIAYSSI